MAILLRANTTTEVVQPNNGTDFSLEELHAFVDGYIEVVQTINPYLILVVDDEGKLKNKPMNYAASLLYGDYIVGDALLCESREVK